MSPKNKKKGGDAAVEQTPRDDEAATEEEEEEATGSKRDGADVSKVTDFVEQKELDSAKASKALADITSTIKVDREAEAARERELAAVSIEQVRARVHDSERPTLEPRDPARPRAMPTPDVFFSHAPRLRFTAGGCGPDRGGDGAEQRCRRTQAARAQGRRRGGAQYARRRLSARAVHAPKRGEMLRWNA